jgi:hypothetical protein
MPIAARKSEVFFIYFSQKFAVSISQEWFVEYVEI